MSYCHGAHPPGNAARHPLNQHHEDRRALGDQSDGLETWPLRVLPPGLEVFLQTPLKPAPTMAKGVKQQVAKRRGVEGRGRGGYVTFQLLHPKPPTDGSSDIERVPRSFSTVGNPEIIPSLLALGRAPPSHYSSYERKRAAQGKNPPRVTSARLPPER